MQPSSLEILRCPRQFLTEAMSLVLAEVAPTQRREVAGGLLDAEPSEDLANEALYVAVRGNELRGSAWGQRQPGSLAIFWPPRLVGGESQATAISLAECVVAALDVMAVEMTQTLVTRADQEFVPLLEQVGFHPLAELLYMTCEAVHFPKTRPEGRSLKFTIFNERQLDRLASLIERTYEKTLDCVALNGVRDLHQVIAGYQATGQYRAENWLIASDAEQDIGVLLLADHPKARHWELMYMGIVPEARGRNYGQHLALHAQWLAQQAGVERIVMAVDAANTPALNMYRRSSFETWDRRTVYIRFPGGAACSK